MELNATSRVILGMLGRRPMSGYDIKRLVDRSTRFFWAASYGQIYPELRRLTDVGLIDATEEPQGARKRISYRLTAAGRRTHRDWLAAPPQIHESRDESLLKIFFSDFGGREATIAALEAKRDHHAAVAERLRAIGPEQKPPEDSALLALRFGIAFNDFIVDWCEREAESARAQAAERSVA